MVDYVVGDDGVTDGDDRLELNEYDGEELLDDAEERDEDVPEPPAKKSSREPSAPDKDSFFTVYRPHLIFACLAALYLVVSIATIGVDYIDFGDGNYLYLSWRVAEGDRLYRDLPSPQPPLHLLWGALLIKGGLGVVRAWQAVQHILIACMVWTLGEELSGRKAAASMGACLFLFLPEGYWWALGYQSEGLLILLLTFGVVAYLRGVRGGPWSPWIMLCGFSACLSLFTNMTALVYVAVQCVALALTHPKHFKRGYLFSLIIPTVILFVFFFFWSEGEYVRHVWSRQIATFPGDGFIENAGYFLRKLLSEGGDIAEYEGALTVVAILGMVLLAGMPKENVHEERYYLLWWGMSTIGSILFVTKGGTVEYIFTIGEPAVATFTGFFLHTLFMGADLTAKASPQGPSRFLVTTRWLLVLALLFPILFWRAGQLIVASTARSMSVIELPEPGVKYITKMITQRARPNEPILAPAHYAYVAQRPLGQHLSSILILTAAYYSEFNDLYEFPDLDRETQNQLAQLPFEPDPMRGLDAERPGYTAPAIATLIRLFDKDPNMAIRYPAIAQFIALNRQMRRQELPIVILNIRHMVSSVPLLQEGIHNYYRPIDLNIPLNQIILAPPNRLMGRTNALTLADRYNPNENTLYSREEVLRFYEPRRFSVPSR